MKPLHPDTFDVRAAALVVIAAGVTVFLLQQMQAFFAPLALALLLFYALDPIVDALERIRLPRWCGAAVVLGLTVIGVSAGAYALQDQALTVINELPNGAKRIAAMWERLPTGSPSPIEKVEEAAETLQKADEVRPAPGVVRVQVEERRFGVTDLLWSGSPRVFSALNQLFMILFLTYFILLSDKMYRRKFVELGGPTLADKKVTLEIIDSIASQIGRFLAVMVITSAVVGTATWAALELIGLEQAPLWGLLAGVLNSIPYYGPLVVSGMLAIVALLQFGTPSMMLGVAAVALVITSLEGWLLTPLLMGKAAAMNRVAVFVGLLFWTWVWGVAGLLLAVPMMMSIKVICDHVDDLKPIGRFLGE